MIALVQLWGCTDPSEKSSAETGLVSIKNAVIALEVRPCTSLTTGDIVRGTVRGDDVFDVVGVSVRAISAQPKGPLGFDLFEVTLPTDAFSEPAGSTVWLNTTLSWRDGTTEPLEPPEAGSCSCPDPGSPPTEAGLCSAVQIVVGGATPEDTGAEETDPSGA